MPFGTDKLTRALVALEAGRPLPPDVATWLRAGLDRYLSADCASLDAALGLRMERYRKRIELRNSYLREAASMVALSPVPDWERANRLSAELRAFKCKERTREAVSELDRMLAAAFELCPKMPTTPRHLYRVLTKG